MLDAQTGLIRHGHEQDQEDHVHDERMETEQIMPS